MEIDYNTCSMDDVIRRSILLHPLLFASAMRDVSRIHQHAAGTLSYRDTEAKRIAIRMCDDACNVANAIDGIDHAGIGTDPAGWSFSARIMAFSAAARLNCLSFANAQYIAAREG
jgi:hypothetical protein